MRQQHLDIARQVLDRQLIDSNNIPCGKVDDLEIEYSPGGQLEVKAILVGPGARHNRLPGLLRTLAKKVFGDEIIRVPWQAVSVITSQIKLESRAGELGLDRADSQVADLIRKIPGA
jgi:sporulation protein YlmC with PRC-barrel domain